MEQVHLWFDAVRVQEERVRTAASAGASPGAISVDALFLIVAMYRLQRACEWAGRRFEPESQWRLQVDRATAAFVAAFPDLEPLRHGQEHFDNWIEGDGRRQIKPTRWSRPFRPCLSYGRGFDGAVTDFTVGIDDLSLDVLAAATAAMAMGRRVNDVFNEELARSI